MSSTSEVTIGGLVGTRWKPALSVEVTDGIAVITFDLPNESVNKLTRAVKDEFVALVTRLERDMTVHGAVLISGKPDVWIAGADIEEFLQLKTAADAERLSRDGQMLLDSLERLRVPIVAAIHGACLGGGLETALACRYRIGTDHPKTILGLPEVQLGLIPGAGGTQRLPRRIGRTDVSRQLIFLFFATNELKKDPGVDPSQYPELPVSSFEPLPVEKIAIIGAGFMGAGIASIAVQHGSLVRLKDADHARVAKGYAAVRDVLKERLTKKQITRIQYSDYMALLGGTVDYSGFGNVDLVIEAVFEDLAVKHQVLRETEAAISPSAIFATNTSTIPIALIAQASSRPERVLGMHFFSPVHKMPLVEVITTADTHPQVTATAVAYAKRPGKTVIVVKDGPGVDVNRCLPPDADAGGRVLDH